MTIKMKMIIFTKNSMTLNGALPFPLLHALPIKIRAFKSLVLQIKKSQCIAIFVLVCLSVAFCTDRSQGQGTRSNVLE
jgi:hypothetical protein